MSEQAQSEMSPEEAEGTVARGLAGLPEVASAHYTAHHEVWDLVVVHDSEDDVGAIERIVRQIIGFEGRVPHLRMDPMVVSTSEEERSGITAGRKTIYRRR